MRTPISAGLLVLTTVPGLALAADEISPWASIAGVYSSNAQQTSSGGEDATAVDTVAGLRVRRGGPLFIDADASLLYRDYVQGNLPGQLLPAANVLMIGTIVQDRFTLTAEDSLGQLSTQPFDALNQAARQNTNVITAGPDVTLPIGQHERVSLDGRYTKATYQSSNIDSNSYTGHFGLAHIFSERSQIGANYAYERVTYDQSQLYPAAAKDTAYLSAKSQGARTFIVLEGGVEKLKIDTVDGDSKSTPHVSVAIQRRLTPRLTISADFGHGYSNAAESVQASVRSNLLPGDNQNVQAVANPFTVDRGSVALFERGSRGSVALRLTTDRERYVDSPLLDRTVRGADLVVDRNITRLWSFAGVIRYSRQEYVNATERSHSIRGSLGLTRQIGRSVQVALVVQRSRSDGTGALDAFSENRASLVLSYTPQTSSIHIFDPVGEFHRYDRTGGRPLSTEVDAPVDDTIVQ